MMGAWHALASKSCKLREVDAGHAFLSRMPDRLARLPDRVFCKARSQRLPVTPEFGEAAIFPQGHAQCALVPLSRRLAPLIEAGP